MTKHRRLLKWIDDMARMCKPDEIIWIDGSRKQKEQLEDEACSTGEILKLNQEKYPGCFYHRTDVNDVARTENVTYICTKKKDDAGPNNNWMSTSDGYSLASKYFKGSMKGRKMYVIPFSMGPVGSEFSKIGIELTDSIYVVLNMMIMTRVGNDVLDALGLTGEFTKCLHSKAELDSSKRLILHFPEDNTIWSVNSGYGGNVLLGKKCLALRLASYMGKNESWMAEHMLIMGVEEPNGHVEYIAAAFPSACGKTNLAMLIPPAGLKKKGYRIWTVGDDISWMRIDRDGGLWAINPEKGFFGVAPGTNSKTNPNAVATIKKNTIFTNVILTKDNGVWWDDADAPIPEEGTDWRGNPWKPGKKDKDGNIIKGAHPNGRFTTPIEQCPSASFRIDQPHGVPISAIIFGGRRATLAPLVYEARNWAHGVYMGATMASERTAAQYGKLGEVRRDPMAMLPFCGYNMGDYFRHWLDMGEKMKKVPRIFHVNWFKVGDDGKFLWPGYGENLRVIEWILDRCNGRKDAVETAIGYIPELKDIDMTGLKVSKDKMEKLFEINKAQWVKELDQQKEFFSQFGDRMPQGIWDEYYRLKEKLSI